MYTPHYYDALLELCPAEATADYSMYVRQILRRKHCGKIRKYRR